MCKDLNKENQYRRFGKEAIIFFEDLWGEKADEMDARMTKKFLREIKDLASSVRDYERGRLYQDVYQVSWRRDMLSRFNNSANLVGSFYILVSQLFFTKQGRVDLCKSYRNPKRKIGVATHLFEIISLESQQKC